MLIARPLAVVEAVGVAVHRVDAAELGSLGVHRVAERGDGVTSSPVRVDQRLAYVFGDRHRRVVARRDEERVERVLEREHVALLKAGARLAHFRCRGADDHMIGKRHEPLVDGVERDHAGHDLGDRGDLRGRRGVALEVHGAVLVHHAGVERVDAGALRDGQPACLDGLPLDDVGAPDLGRGDRGKHEACRERGRYGAQEQAQGRGGRAGLPDEFGMLQGGRHA